MQNLNLTDPNQIAAVSMTLALQEAVQTEAISQTLGTAILARADDIRLSLIGGATINVDEATKAFTISPKKIRSLAEILEETEEPELVGNGADNGLDHTNG